MIVKILVFIAGSILITGVSWKSLRSPRSHGFHRFFAWEFILALILLNIGRWFDEPFAWHQVISWILLIVSFVPLIYGIHFLHSQGKPARERVGDSALMGFEKTTALVTSGIFEYIRHPLYSSLLLLVWGVFFKDPSWAGAVLLAAATLFLVATARADEAECIRFFGPDYREYMQHTKMFIPFVL